jgi:hypothetical protein
MAPPPPLGRWKVSYHELQDFGKSCLAPGFLVLLPKNWLALVNHKDAPIVGKYLQNGEVFYSGSSVRFPSHLVSVLSCLVSPLGFSSLPEAPPVRWRVVYAPLGNSLMSEDNKFPMGKSAFLILKPNAKRLVLLDAKEQVHDARFLLLDETVCTSHSLDIQVFSVLVG